MYYRERMRISDFEWDDGNVLPLALGHGIEPEEVGAVFVVAPLLGKTRRGHHAAFGRTPVGRLLVLVFELKRRKRARVITGWDMDPAERRYSQGQREV